MSPPEYDDQSSR